MNSPSSDIGPIPNQRFLELSYRPRRTQTSWLSGDVERLVHAAWDREEQHPGHEARCQRDGKNARQADRCGRAPAPTRARHLRSIRPDGASATEQAEIESTE